MQNPFNPKVKAAPVSPTYNTIVVGLTYFNNECGYRPYWLLSWHLPRYARSTGDIRKEKTCNEKYSKPFQESLVVVLVSIRE
ncbi:hypothetical protein OUZ56_009011 [Daphnia magna]|uniref:Uncharacterized protein n=1 Tax=Daphnia magna TaxID=35525 RepID=A0ABR0AER0_9CRUS|nr:hypothetical protein OUZ56_009011 [Daphnia magna]